MSHSLWSLKMLACTLCCGLSLMIVGCGGGDDDGDGNPDGASPINFSKINSPQGSSLTLTYPDGKVETVTSTAVLGWESVQLLNGNYAVVLRFSGGDEQYWLRYSLNSKLSWEQEVYREHGLSGKLALEDTSDLAGVTAEFYTFDDEPFAKNALGTVELRKNVEHGALTYDLVGIIDVQWMTPEGVATMKGNLWVQELN